MMISKLRWFLESKFWRFMPWLEWRRVCYNCLEYEAELVLDHVDHYCKFRDGMTIDPNDTCRAFKGWRKTE